MIRALFWVWFVGESETKFNNFQKHINPIFPKNTKAKFNPPPGKNLLKSTNLLKNVANNTPSWIYMYMNINIQIGDLDSNTCSCEIYVYTSFYLYHLCTGRSVGAVG